MSNSKVSNKINEILNMSRIGILSTAHNNVPNSRYMVFYNDGNILYTKTNINSIKIDEIQSNPKAHILLGYDDTKNRSYLEIEATLSIVQDQETIDWLWKRQDKSFFDNSEDPELCVLKILPNTIKIMNDNELDQPEIVKFD
ncbi:pyridoxamine 5'-phosphate oxidase family protein [Staphylococcus pseudoxylosus]|uniref:pyridoxamine 5'-phosphate oxidase family protein n=1 Tax=Staphylococcus pseudoxylosus TaxID=2282419 RepID=UPI000D1EFDD2|nr:pyridoxamine 5'-phosphate oxidase family protein [Staphylococcus pseudoxylosus]PTI59704.1 pyridoxamine 5-phosphate oxidase [Staphylococcus xylosus]MDW8797604.1 pyridoxamine 5'-phosphate oxidase family protein [Staphylococcus pseudoxylosus]MEB6038241.1 pyridoxamine 5'-phosphate oxidase family protein [Staphylococcus pseudoxylosus]MEB6062148.1 pyridoxamine 5'-phosphate oxidase family protein [Staphylococcus pseudoxylosus]MEB7765422.1 pyridoxamine 5'-phosphate oxidase family protein [Staphyloc